MTGLTLVTLLVIAAVTMGRITFGQALAIGASTPAGAALIVGGTVVPTFYAVGLATAGALGLGVLGIGRWRKRQPLPPGGVLLLCLLAWSTLVTMSAPLLFDGLPIVHPVFTQLSAGTLTSSNIAQLTYLALGICVVVILARSQETGPGLLGIALGSTLVLAFARYVSQQAGLPFPEGFFDSSPRFNYIETAAGGVERFRGIHSEPSALASTCVTGIAYFGLYAFQSSGWRRVGCLAIVAAAVQMGVVSTSATFVVAGLISGTLLLGVVLVRFAAQRTSVTLSIGLVVCAAIVLAGLFVPTALAFVQSTVDDKLGSDSFDARSSTDSLSMGVFLDTYGFGVGLGSARGSSFMPTMLSAVGVIGTLLLAAVILTVVFEARHERACRPVVWALAAFLVVKLTSSPDLSGPDGTLWISLGILSHAALRSRARSAAAHKGGQLALTPHGRTAAGPTPAVTAGRAPATGAEDRRVRPPRSREP